MTGTFAVDDWRDVGRILGLLHRFGCSLERLEVERRDGTLHAHIDYQGSPESHARLKAQIDRVLRDAKEMLP
jgi:hypothetical protein